MLTKRMAIRECKKLWEEIEESGLSKDKFLSTKAGKLWREKSYCCDCPLCEYDLQFDDDCKHCPLKTQYKKGCHYLGFDEYNNKPSQKWLNTIKGLKE